jgi:hypothetical protein
MNKLKDKFHTFATICLGILGIIILICAVRSLFGADSVTSGWSPVSGLSTQSGKANAIIIICGMILVILNLLIKRKKSK